MKQWDRRDRALDGQMACMGQTDGGMSRHREGQDRQARARTDVWAREGQRDL